MRIRVISATLVTLMSLTVIGCELASLGAGGSVSGPETSPRPGPGTELASQVADLQVRDEDPAGYERELFGDYDRGALLEASEAERGCYWSAADATCHDDSGDVHVDHVVALAEAWASGASGWPAARLDEFAGDPANLWLMTAGLNMAKSDDDPVEWLPPADEVTCWYVATWVSVKLEYELTVDRAERDVLLDEAADCD